MSERVKASVLTPLWGLAGAVVSTLDSQLGLYSIRRSKHWLGQGLVSQTCCF